METLKSRNPGPIGCIFLLLSFALLVPGTAEEPESQVHAALPASGSPFFAQYPDLADEQETVAGASRELASEGFTVTDDDHAALAARTRAILSQRTVLDWQKKAICLYPELGVAGSEFNALFLQHYRELRVSTPAFAQEPFWPVLLAKRCADELHAREAVIPAPRSLSPAPSPVDLHPTTPAVQRGPSGVGLALQGAGLIVTALLPCLLLFRWSHALASTDSVESRASSPWFRALKPAAVAYSMGAIAAILRSLPENIDLSLADRTFITLLVSVLFGGCVGLIGYLFALLYCALHPRGGQPSAHFH